MPKIKNDPDFVDRVIAYLQKIPKAQEVFGDDATKWAGIEKDLRHHFGGGDVYIRKRPRTAPAVLELFNGRNATEVANQLGISRVTVYRCLKQPGLR